MIRKLTLQDLNLAQDLFLSVFSKEPWNDEWDLESQLPSYMIDLMGNPNSLCLGYEDKGKLIGLSLGYTFHWWQGTDYFIKEFCIDASLQGEGHGKKFMAEIEAYLAQHSIKALWLLTEKTVPAYDFYHKNGFTELKDNVMFAKSVKPF